MNARSPNAHLPCFAARASALILLTSVVALALAGCDRSGTSDQDQDYHHLAETLVVTEQPDFTAERELPGIVLPGRVSELGFEISGRVIDIAVDEGTEVAAGDRLARLDTELLQSERASLEAQRQELNASLDLNRKTLTRTESLRESNFAADQRLDELRAERQQLQAALQRLQAELAANQTRINKSDIRAPFNGQVSRRHLDEGTVVEAGRPVLRLIEGGPMEARINVPTRFVDDFSADMSLSLRIADRTVAGRVIAVGTDVERPTLTVPVRVEVPAGSAIAGDLVYARTAETITQNGFWIPVSALRDGVRGMWQVYTVGAGDSPELYRIESRDVQVRYLDQHRAFVSGALQHGERIVADGLHRLVPGQIVRIRDTSLARR